MKKTLLFMLTLLLMAVGAAAQPDWGYDPNAHEGEHVVYVNLVDASGAALTLGQGDYLGAFIEGECRGQQIARTATGSTTDLWYFPIRVKGSAADNGKPITFRYRDASGGRALDYDLSGPTALTYDNEATTGTLSDLHPLTFVRPNYYSIADNRVTLHVGEQVDLRSRFTFEPSNANFPLNVEWDFSNSQSYIRVTDNVLTGLAPGRDLYLGANLGDIKCTSEISWFTVDVIRSATTITIGDDFRDGITVNVGDEATLTKLLSSCYTVAPADCNEELTWSCADDGITTRRDDNGGLHYTPVKAGTYTMTLKGEKATATVLVTVVQPVTGIQMTAPIKYLNIYVGENASDLLGHAFEVQPADATDKRLTYEVAPQSASGVLTDRDGALIATRRGEATVIVRSADNPQVSSSVPVIVSDRVTSLTFKQDVLAFVQPKTDTDQMDYIDELLANIVMDGTVEANSNVGLSIESDNDAVLRITYNLWNTADANSAIVGELGAAHVTVTYTAAHTELSADGTLSDQYVRLSGHFTVNVVEGLKGFTYTDILMGASDTYELRLTPDPATARVDASKIELRLVAPSLPDGWTWATATPADDSRLSYTLTPQSVGSGHVQVYYDGQLMASHTLTIGQRVEQKAGWKWMSLFAEDIADIHASFGDPLQEMRSADALLYNDPEYGYFGDLTALTTGTCYKVKVKEGEPGYVSFVTQATDYDASSVREYPMVAKWNWLGNRYQYDHALNGLFVSDGLAEGDRIVSKDDGFAEYQGGQWVGTLTTLLAGQGYLFYNADATKTTLYVNPENLQEQGTPVLHAPRRHPSVWVYNSAPYADNMSIVAQLPAAYATPSHTVGVFVDGECRGEGQMVDGHCFITAHADRGERLSFVLHDAATGEYRTIAETLPFAQMAGTLRAPVRMSVGAPTDVSTATIAASAIRVVDGRLSFAGLSLRHFTVANASGAVVLTDEPSLDSLAPGIYIVRVLTTDGKTLTRKIAL